jgi:hypothetical protein
MSVKVSSWVWHDESLEAINGNELVFLLSLADVADDNGRCRYLADDEDLTYRSLARKVRISVRTVVTLVGRLRELGRTSSGSWSPGPPVQLLHRMLSGIRCNPRRIRCNLQQHSMQIPVVAPLIDVKT